MDKAEAIKVMTDVAIHRAPHNRARIKEALDCLEPPASAPAPKKKKSSKGD